MVDHSSTSIKVLAVDDDEDALFALESLLLKHNYQVITATSGNDTLKKARDERPDIILLDVMMPDMTGFDVVQILKGEPEFFYTPIVMLTANDQLEDRIEGLDRGADDYITKPFQTNDLLARLRVAVRTRQTFLRLQGVLQENDQLRSRVNERASFANIVGKSHSMQKLFDLIVKVKDANVPVLITGESGTGKELVASAIHFNSPRKDRPFVVQNCSALNENLLESELFGHVRGAFTGAVKDKVGLFEAADTGTFFLDELGEMSQALQVKLLRVLQDGSFTPVGSTKGRKVDVRIVAATNRDLRAMVERGQFREDLFYRLNVVNIQLPPLRERKDDIPNLVLHFLAKNAKRANLSNPKTLSTESLKALCNYHWPGNIRELENEIERVVLMSGADSIVESEHLSPHVVKPKVSSSAQDASVTAGNLKDAVENLERSMIMSVLEKLHGNKSEAARVLGISRSNLISKVQSYGLEPEGDES